MVDVEDSSEPLDYLVRRALHAAGGLFDGSQGAACSHNRHPPQQVALIIGQWLPIRCQVDVTFLIDVLLGGGLDGRLRSSRRGSGRILSWFAAQPLHRLTREPEGVVRLVALRLDALEAELLGADPSSAAE